MTMFNSNRSYQVVDNFITKEQANFLADSFINYCNNEKIYGDNQVPVSQSVKNFPLFLELLCDKVPEVSRLIGEPVLPTYVYSRVYKKGSDLKKHIDREACEVSITLNLKKDCNWPISIVSEGRQVTLELEPGMAMLYKGCEAEHWREEYKGDEYVQIFLHYVRSRGKNSFAAFDTFRNKEDFIKTGGKTFDMISSKIENSNLTTVDYNRTQTYRSDVVYTDEHINELKKYIVVVKEALTKEECKTVLKEYKKSDEWKDAAVGNGQPKLDIRNVKTISISQPPVLEKNPAVRKQIDQLLFQKTNSLITKYASMHPFCSITEDTGYELLKYETGGFYIQHTDSFTIAPRELSCSLLLNNKFEGGQFAFFNGKLTYELNRGDAILFPSNFLYPHEITAVTSGTRYSIITWFR